MGCCGKTFAVLTLAVGLGVGYYWHRLDYISELPDLQDTYWGKAEPKPDDPAVKPFKIQFTDAAVKDLLDRLSNTRELTPPLEGVGFSYGMNSDYLKSILTYWRTEYNFKERQDFLNQYPHFKTQVSGLSMHYLHAKPDKTKIKNMEVVPLLLLHGWPGSVREFYEMIPMLTSPRKGENFVFEVIAPSLPGYGFSEGTTKTGLGPAQMAVIMNKLMNKIGFKKYYVQGGDWGSAIGQALAVHFPENVVGFHSNFCFVQTTKASIKMALAYAFPWLYVEENRRESFRQQPIFHIEETGYMHIQATKPDTVGVGLMDSPAGLAAYILEKFSTWTYPAWRNKPDGGLSHFNKANLIDNVMIYWISGSITTSMRLYSEMFNKHQMNLLSIPVNIPTGCARFPSELTFIPESVLKSVYRRLVRLTDMTEGGHFAAFELPEVLAEDIWQFAVGVRRGDKPLN